MDDVQPASYTEYMTPLFYDEEKKRFMRTGIKDWYLKGRMFATYSTQRPDLYGNDADNFFVLPIYTGRILRVFQKIRAYHFNQLNLTYGHLCEHKTTEVAEDYLYHRDAVDLPVGIYRLWHWDDQTKMQHWLHLNFCRLIEYGMHYPLFSTAGLPKEHMNKTENELTDYFIAEMSKRPKATNTP